MSKIELTETDLEIRAHSARELDERRRRIVRCVCYFEQVRTALHRDHLPGLECPAEALDELGRPRVRVACRDRIW